MTILHLACHGLQHAEDPLKSGFVMQDGVLTIEQLMPLPLPHAFLAFLSACETAKGDKVLLPFLNYRSYQYLHCLRHTGSARPNYSSRSHNAVRRVQERHRHSLVHA
jgi:hypothetical protein